MRRIGLASRSLNSILLRTGFIAWLALCLGNTAPKIRQQLAYYRFAMSATHPAAYPIRRGRESILHHLTA